MKYKNIETGEIWSEGNASTSRTSNFYLLTHDEKVAAGWELLGEPENLEQNTMPLVPLDTLKSDKIAGVKSTASKLILEKYPQYKQINAALGIYSGAETTAIFNYIQSIRSQVTAFESLIAEQQTAEDLNFEIVFEEQ